MKRLLFASIALSIALLPRRARADLLVLSDDSGTLDATGRAGWVNVSRCGCAETMTATLDLTGLSADGRVALVAGKSCLTSDSAISDGCRTLWSATVGAGDTIRAKTFTAEDLAGSCASAETTLSVWLLYDQTDAGTYTTLTKLDLGVDTRPPIAPTASQVIAGEKLVEVSFAAGEDDEENDALKYQVLCTKKGGGVVKTSPPSAAFDSGIDRCSEGTDSVLSATYVCAEAETGASSVTVQALEDGVIYEFSVVAIDGAKNASKRVAVGEATPALEEDFWERYQRSGGQADGTGCSAVGPPGVEPMVLVLAALAIRRKRA